LVEGVLTFIIINSTREMYILVEGVLTFIIINSTRETYILVEGWFQWDRMISSSRSSAWPFVHVMLLNNSSTARLWVNWK